MKTLQEIFSNHREEHYKLYSVNGYEEDIYTSFWGAMNHARIPGIKSQLACYEEPGDITSWAMDKLDLDATCWLEDEEGNGVPGSTVWI